MLRSSASVLAALSFVVISSQPAAQEVPQQAIGDWWILREPRTGALQTLIVKEIAGNGDFTLIDEKTSEPFAVFTSGLNKKRFGDRTFRPHNWSLPPFPLSAGKTWDEWMQSSGPRGSGSIRMKGEVKGPEEISLRLLDGTEKRLSAIRVDVSVYGQGFPAPATCWYAEEVRFTVKCTSPDERLALHEVVAYGKSGDPKPKYP